jgi:mono/diheme cytochrome c family protein
MGEKEVPMRILILPLLAAGLIACTPPTPTPTGAQDFADLCAPCHGTGGKGDGPMAADLAKKPADLTGLAARSGGEFPMIMVMNKIWGYSRGAAVPSMMPKFQPLLDSDTVLVDLGDGVQTPTPQRLINLADYLKTIQG